MQKIQIFQKVRGKLLPYLLHYRKWLILTIAFLLLKESAGLIEPTIFRQVIVVFEKFFNNASTRDQVINKMFWLIVSFIGLQSTVILANLFMLRYLNRLESSVMRDAANNFIEKILNLSFRFHTERKTGKLAREFSRGVGAIEHFVDAFIFNLTPLGFRLIVIFAVYFFVDWALALLLLVMAICFCVFTVYGSLRIQKRRGVANLADDEGSRRAIDALMNAEAVKYFHKEREEIGNFKNLRADWQKKKQHEWDGWMWISTGQIAINVTTITLMLWVMLTRLLNGSLGLPDFVMVITYLGSAVGVLWDFQHCIRRLEEALTDLDAFFHYFNQENEIKDIFAAQPLTVTRGEIRFEKVTFGYADSKDSDAVVTNINFVIPAGKSIAFIGPSGVGKSTLIKLLYRFYDPQEGKILIDGQDIHLVTQKSLRQYLSIVPQDTALFNASVAYNISYGTLQATPEQISEAAKKSRAHDFIMNLPSGYDTLVGERGVKLSGGEKQRISIARAFLRNTPILVLDEATASLDSKMEAEIQESLRELVKGRTTLIIAHRLSTIMDADKILVIKNGCIAETGSHEDLIQQKGVYAELWKLQAGGYIG